MVAEEGVEGAGALVGAATAAVQARVLAEAWGVPNHRPALLPPL